MAILQLPVGDALSETDEALVVYTVPNGNVCISLPDGWDGAWLTAGNGRRLAEWLDANVEV